ncbi:MAG: tyrosine-protein phosphatase [Hamadaea sp.]|uniref:tyrosine-protein phosphatase n=1 Tax=Hamadaea sp. TaxID=2024425 RepID=UPI0017AF1855|nr:tyrosine-protein phosphatase [Hamadaea sp.]NUR71891.1 tyrosine-protein phosphatase [Hamadaea sp.]NUT19911.1 tyrosine-protein phosphatase [Hamadaea sp.]
MPLEFIDFPRVFNLRDLGGLTTRDGRVIRPGLLYRSDNLGALNDEGFTPADRDRFGMLGVRTIIDLRQPAEIERHGGRAPDWACTAWHNVPLNNPAWREEDYSEVDGPASYLLARYHEAARTAGADIARTIGLLADPAVVPAAVHCLGGRDRTGIVIAFVEDLLGVPDETIAADYHFTEQSTRRFMTWFRTVRPDAKDLLPYLDVTPPEVISTFLADLRAEYGSVQSYLELHGLTEGQVQTLRSIYLADV